MFLTAWRRFDDLPDDALRIATQIDLGSAWRSLRPADREVLALIAFDGSSLGLADRPLPPSPAGTVNLETMSSTGQDDTRSNIVGLAGPGVTRGDVRLDNGTVLQASVRNGWWAA